MLNPPPPPLTGRTLALAFAARNPNAPAVLAQAAEIAAKREARLAANPKPPKGAAGQKRKLKPMRGPDGLVSVERLAGRCWCLCTNPECPSTFDTTLCAACCPPRPSWPACLPADY